MTTRYEAEKILYNQFVDNFDSTIPVNFENREDFWLCTNPLTPSVKPDDGLWVRWYCTNGDSDQISFASEGNRTSRRYGMINFQVFIPQGKGKKPGMIVGENIISIYERKDFSGVYCYSGTCRGSGIQDDGFYMIVGYVTYDFDVRI